MTTKIILNVSDEVVEMAKSQNIDIATLLRDALSDFRNARSKVYAYVENRYADQDWRFKERKRAEVEARIQMSLLLPGSVEIEVDANS